MADTAAQAQARRVIGLPDDQEWTDANVSAHLRRQGFSDPSFTNEVLANGAGTSDSIKNMTPVNVFQGYNLPQGGRYTANDPMARNSQFTDKQTGQTLTGGLDPTGRSIVTGFGRNNPSNTVQYDTMTGKRTEADPHPWLDAAKNTAMIWGGPETAGALMGAWGGAAAASGAGAAHSTLPMVGGGLSWNGPAAATTAASTAGHSILAPVLTNAALSGVSTKLGGGSWGQALTSAGISGATGGLAPGLGSLSPALRTAVNFGIGQAGSAAMRAAAGGGGRSGSTATYGRGSEGGGTRGIGPSSGMAPGFAYGDNNPNLADALAYGARLGKANQPFRAGYDVNYPGVAAYGNQPAIPSETRSMPPIFSPSLRTGNGRRRNQISPSWRNTPAPANPSDSSGSDEQQPRSSRDY